MTGTPALEITVDGIKTASGPGSFTLKDGTATVAGGQLYAVISNDQFSSLTVFQTGCCPAFVDLENDIVPGAVAVTEGVANGDGVVIYGPEDKTAPDQHLRVDDDHPVRWPDHGRLQWRW